MRLTQATLIALAGFGAPVLHASEPVTGRWAADPSLCAGQGTASGKAVLMVTNETLRWAGEVCRVGRSYRTGDTLHLEAFCSGKGSKHRIPVSLRLHGDRVFVNWNRVARGGLWRCP
jgi:hypothetical protein